MLAEEFSKGRRNRQASQPATFSLSLTKVAQCLDSRAEEEINAYVVAFNQGRSLFFLQFLTELTRLFQKCRTSGSVFITLKKYDGRTKPVPRKGHVESFEPADNKCLLRATDGKKKISTVVSSKEVNKFQMAYSNLLRANMDGLKKKDKKSKNKKSKATQ
nr:PREDICTED: signal recognition particle 14 kDa protein [Apteryx mantelli mantelli]